MNNPSEPNAARRWKFQFRLRSLFVVVCVVALGLGWWLDRRHLKARVSLLEERNALLGEELKVAQTTRISYSNVETSKLKFSSAGDFIDFIRTEPDWYQFQEAQRLFSGQPDSNDAVPPLLAMLTDPDDKLRVRAASALGVLKARRDSAVPALIPLLKDQVPNVRWHAAFALGQFGPEATDAIPALRAQTDDDSSPIASHAALMLKQIDSSIDIGPRLLQLLRNQAQENRWRALQAVPSHVSKEVAEPILTKMYEGETDAAVRESIAKTLNVYTAKSTTASSNP